MIAMAVLNTNKIKFEEYETIIESEEEDEDEEPDVIDYAIMGILNV